MAMRHCIAGSVAIWLVAGPLAAPQDVARAAGIEIFLGIGQGQVETHPGRKLRGVWELSGLVRKFRPCLMDLIRIDADL